MRFIEKIINDHNKMFLTNKVSKEIHFDIY